MKRLSSIIFFSLVLMICSLTVYAAQDNRILADPVQNTYTGRVEAVDMIQNLNFSDVPSDYWAKEAITRAGALNIVKGYSSNYYPEQPVSNQEAIAFIIRAMGLESQAQALGVSIAPTLPPDSAILTEWSLGYLALASQMGIISQQDFADASAADQSSLDPDVNFVKDAPATREDVAGWIYTAALINNPDAFATTASQQSIYTFNDWQDIDINQINAVEALTSNGIMNGMPDGNFYPKQSLTRAEMAQIFENMDSLYYSSMGIEKKTGTVGAIVDNQATDTSGSDLKRDIYVRTSDGKVDVIQYEMMKSTSPQDRNKDAVVYKNGNVTGLSSIEEGDEIEYLVDTATNEILYVEVLNDVPTYKDVTGYLISVDMENGTITIKNGNKNYTYPLVQYSYGTDDKGNYLYIDNKKVYEENLPIDSKVNITLKNDIADDIKFVGQDVVTPETRGIVVENNPEFGYMTILDSDGNYVTKQYTDNEIVVEKTQYYQNSDDIGYYDNMFPSFEYDPRDTTIDTVEVGDIVYIRTDPNDPETITSISAVTNYTMKYGKVKEIKSDDKTTSMLIEYENGQTEWFTVPNDIYVSKDSKKMKVTDVKVGDWVKLLVNEAVVEPGHTVSSVKEITIEGEEHYISTIVKGELTNIDPIQNKIYVKNVQVLTKDGWSNYQNVASYSLENKNIEYYDENGKRISQDYVQKMYKNSDAQVYIALENNYAGETVKKVTFRTGRDELMQPDTVVKADGNGTFSTVGSSEPITTDPGTIVVKNGRLVDPSAIAPSDYAVVSLNGGNNAAVVNIIDKPDNSQLSVIRARVTSVNEGQSFTVESISILTGDDWIYSPIAREFTIDYDTLFLDENGYVDPTTFRDYTDTTVVGNTYTIVADGSKAIQVIDAPYATKEVKGTIYEIDDTSIKIKDVTYLDAETGQWKTLSDTNNTATVTIPLNSVVLKNNQAVTKSSLQVGDRVKVMTDTLPEEPSSGMNVDGYIIYVEN